MSECSSLTRLRVRYGETDQMGTFYNARALEWFECGRTDYLRMIGQPYVEMEARGVYLPIIEARLSFRGRARYDDELEITTRAGMSGRARVRFDVSIVQSASGAEVVVGHTEHAFTDAAGRALRPPEWFTGALGRAESGR